MHWLSLYLCISYTAISISYAVSTEITSCDILDCIHGNCIYEDCSHPIACSGGLCTFRRCESPSCTGGVCTFEACHHSTCTGGACHFIQHATPVDHTHCQGSGCTIDGIPQRVTISSTGAMVF